MHRSDAVSNHQQRQHDDDNNLTHTRSSGPSHYPVEESNHSMLRNVVTDSKIEPSPHHSVVAEVTATQSVDQNKICTIDHYNLLLHEPTESNITTTASVTKLENPVGSPDLVVINDDIIGDANNHNVMLLNSDDVQTTTPNAEHNCNKMNTQTEEESTSSETRKDDEGKQGLHQGLSSHPPNVHEQAEIPVPNSNDVATSPTANVPRSGVNRSVEVDDVRQAAIRSKPAYIESSLGFNKNAALDKQQQQRMMDVTYKDTLRSGRLLFEKSDAVPQATPIVKNNKSVAVDLKINSYNNHNNQNNTELDNDLNHDRIVAEEANNIPNNDDSTAIAINQQEHDVDAADYNTNDHQTIDRQDDEANHQTYQPQTGAVHVDGMNDLLANDPHPDNPRPIRSAYIESSSGLHVLRDGQTFIGSFTLEVDGFVPSIIEPRYLVPEENVQVMEHLYASIEPTSHEENDIEQRRRHDYQKFMHKFSLLSMIIVLIISGIVVIAVVCGRDICHRDHQVSPSEQPNDNYESSYKSFDTRQELFDALDQFLSSPNISSVEETYGSITYWNVSQIQDFSHLFSPFGGNLLKSKFHEDISRWDVSSATNMSFMFYGARDFRGDISQWNVSQVTDMQYFMAVTNKFDGNLSRWDTSRLVNTSHMFYDSSNFSGIGMENWNVGRVYDMTSMFASLEDCYVGGAVRDSSYCKTFTKFNGNLSTWDVSNVHYMASMFQNAGLFQGIGIEDWDTRKVETMNGMFQGAKSFDANLSKWNLSNVQDTAWMFDNAYSFHGVGVEHWDTSNVETMSGMFSGANSFNANLSNWNVSNVQDTSSMFYGASSFQGIGLEDWDTSKVFTMSMMFMFWLTSSFDANLSKWNVSNVQDTSYMFYYASLFQGVGLNDWDTSNVKAMQGMFWGASSFDANLSNWNVSNVQDTSYMFSSAFAFFDANLSKWNLSNVQDTSGMFYNAYSFQGVGIEDWDMSNVETMSEMFYNASSFDANLSRWNLSNVQDTSFMFASASFFRGVGVELWDTSKVKFMSRMFMNALSFDANLSSWDVANVIDMSYMFSGAISFRGDGLEVWNVSHVNETEFMFDSATVFHANLSNWDVSNIENATAMFLNAISFDGVSWWNETSDTIRHEIK